LKTIIVIFDIYATINQLQISIENLEL